MSLSHPLSHYKPDHYLYYGRFPLLVISLAWIVYISTNIQILPANSFDLAWRPDVQLQIVEVGESFRSLVEIGDIILAVDGVPVERTKPTFPIQQDSHELTIQRGEQILIVRIPFSETASLEGSDYPPIILSIVLWGSAAILFFLATPENRDGLQTGGVFLLLQVWVISFVGALDGVPGAWIAGHSLLFPVGVSMAYLGFLFNTASNSLVGRVFKYAFGIATVLGAVGLLEVIFLYPTSSIEAITGISWLTLGFLFIVIGLVLHPLILIIRRSKSRQIHTRRQLNVLLLFIIVGTAPAVITVLYPDFGILFIPNGFVFGFLLLIPAGYIFLINRSAYLLDRLLINLITICILALVAIMAYRTVFSLVQQIANTPQNTFNFSLGVGVPLAWIFIRSRSPLVSYTEQLMYGRQILTERTIKEFTSAITSHPDLETLQSILDKTAQGLNIGQTVVVLFQSGKELLHLSNDGTVDKQLVNEIQAVFPALTAVDKPILRHIDEDNPIFQSIQWTETVIPLYIRHNLTGVFMASRPMDDPFINEKQVTLLSLVAEVISVGYDTMTLLESSLELSGRLLHIQEVERKMLAAQIHDDPLQKLLATTKIIEQANQEIKRADIEQGVGILREVNETLRHICIGLRPLALEHGIEVALKAVVHNFRQTYPQYHLEVHIEENEVISVSEAGVSAIYYIAIEALNNIAKHAQAATIQISLTYDDTHATMIIQDDGLGNPRLNLSTSELLRQGHLGLLGMREWAKKADGYLSFVNSATGMTVKLEIPVLMRA